MRDIYASAERTVVWLGHSTDGSDRDLCALKRHMPFGKGFRLETFDEEQLRFKDFVRDSDTRMILAEAKEAELDQIMRAPDDDTTKLKGALDVLGEIYLMLSDLMGKADYLRQKTIEWITRFVIAEDVIVYVTKPRYYTSNALQRLRDYWASQLATVWFSVDDQPLWNFDEAGTIDACSVSLVLFPPRLSSSGSETVTLTMLLTDFTKLLRRPWFESIGVIQEAAIAKNDWLQCGGTSIRHKIAVGQLLELGRRLRTNGRTNVGNEDADKQLVAISSISDDVSHKRLNKSLAEIATQFHRCKASEPRDKVLGLLRLITDDNSCFSNTDIGYELPVSHIYAHVARYEIYTLANCDLLYETQSDSMPESRQRPDLADILDSKTNFLRIATYGATTITIEELSLSKTSATVIARLFQNGKLSMVLMASVGNLLLAKGPTFETNWALDPCPYPADTSKMARNEDPEWLSYQVPWDPKSFLTYMTHAVQFFPARSHENTTIRDLCLQAIDVDPNFGWTNDHLEYLADMTLSPLESWQGEKAAGSHGGVLRLALEQKADREARRPLQAKLKGFSPFNSFSTSMNVDVKKRLPAEGVKWLFTRTTSRLAKNGRMDWDITIHDESGDLVAVVYGLHQIVELRNVPLPGTTKGSTAPKM